MTPAAPPANWSTATPDWKERIREGRSLIPDLPLHAEMADKALAIFKRLRIPDIYGQPTNGEACGQWDFDLVRAIFGSLDPVTRQRAIQEFFLLVPKGNGKSSKASSITMTWLIMNERPNAEGLFIAPRMKVAELAYKQAADMIALDADLAQLFHVRDHLKRIEHLTTGAFAQIKAADTDIVSGSKAAFILIDETHEFATKPKAEAIYLELRGSLGKRRDGFMLQITTQSKAPPAGVFKSELAMARKVRDGEIVLPLLPVLYELPVEDVIDGGWKRRETWPLVNPNLNRSIWESFLVDELTKAEEQGPDKLAQIASQHFNVEIGVGLHGDRWPGALFWESAAMPGLTLDRIMEVCDVCAVGVDGGGLDDLFAVAVLGRHRKTRAWLHWARAWAHPEVFERRKEIAARLRDFEKAGDLVVCEEPDQDVLEAADICERLWRAGLLPEKSGIGLDVFGVATLIDELAGRGMSGDLVVGVGQGWKLQSAVLTLPRKLKDRSMRHCGQPLMAWAVGNAKTELKGSNYVVTKQAAGSAKIDPLMASFNAAMLMFLNPSARGGIDAFLNDPVMAFG